MENLYYRNQTIQRVLQHNYFQVLFICYYARCFDHNKIIFRWLLYISMYY
jgi:hypothetical protein